MPWGVVKANTMRGISQELAARLFRLQDAGFTFEPEVFLNPTALGDPFDECCREVVIELISDEDPSRLRIRLDSGHEVSGEVRLGARRTEGRTDDFAGHDIEVRDQPQVTMPTILELDAFDRARPHGVAKVSAFQRLQAGILIDTHDVRAFAVQLWRVAVGVTESLDIRLISLGSFPFVLRSEPVLTLVRSQFRCANKRSTCCGEILSTRPRHTISRANSVGVQCVTGC